MSASVRSVPYDTLICGGRLIDGTGEASFSADLAIKEDRIAAIGDLKGSRATQEIGIRGKYLTPGFIDTHTHDDRACMDMASMAAKISQGVTCVVAGNCGVSLAPLADPPSLPEPLNLLGTSEDFRFADFASYVEAVEQAQPSTNVVALVGHSSLRTATMSDLERPASASELKAMLGMLDESLRAGAAGLSTGVFYPSGRAANNEEIVPLLSKTSEFGGVYATHIRDEREQVLESMREALDAARRGGVAMVFSHHKCAGTRNWGRSRETLALLERAQGDQEVSIDVYPYLAGSSVLIPDLLDGETRVLITWSHSHPWAAGTYLHEIAARWECSEYEAACRLKPAGACYFFINEDDLMRIIRHSSAMIGSDGLPMDTHPHPRLWGTFPRVIRRYAMEKGLFSLEEAIRKMTSLPAQRFHLRNRGVLAAGNYADLVVFDPDTIADRASYEHPTRASDGIVHVFVNGHLSWSLGTQSANGHGRLLRHARKA